MPFFVIPGLMWLKGVVDVGGAVAVILTSGVIIGASGMNQYNKKKKKSFFK